MAKKGGGKADSTERKSRKAAKADGKLSKSAGVSDKNAKSNGLAAAPVGADGKTRGREATSVSPAMPDESASATVVGARRGKSLKSVKASALGLLPSAPSSDAAATDADAKASARELGSRIVALMNEPSGRTFAAELLTAVAAALMKHPAGRSAAETGPDAAGTGKKRRGRRSAAQASSAPPG